MGIGRFWPEPERLLLEEEALSYQPDLVLVLFVDNDVHDTYVGAEGLRVSNGYLINKHASALLGDLGTWLAAHSHFAQLVFSRRFNPTQRRFYFRETFKADGKFESTWNEIEKELESMVHLAAENDTKIVFVSIPNGGKFFDELQPAVDRGYPGRRLTEWAERVGAECIDTYPAFEKAGGIDGDKFFWPLDGHPKPAGYRVLAATVFQELSDRESVP